MTTKLALLPLLVLGAPSLAGCASAPLPPERLAAAESGVRGASEAGAESVPQAALHLKMARDQVAQAKALQQAGDADRAIAFLLRAEADAELALVMTREATARAEAQAVIAQVEALKVRTP